MKKLFLTLLSIALFGTASANSNSNYLGPNNSFIFNEQGIEFAIFKDGQFDFNVLKYRQNSHQFSNLNGVSISFNTGYDYGAYVQYDNYGAVIQIENTPINYDNYGRIRQAGNVHINYDYRGRVSLIGGMHINYNYADNFYCTGYINRMHRYYTPSVWNRYYRVPKARYCVTFSTPYRRHYTPIRYRYKNPYKNNRRPDVYRNRSTHNRVTNTRSNQSDRYSVNRSSRRTPNATKRSAERIASRSTPNRSNSRVANSNSRVRTTPSKRVKHTKPITRNQNVVAQRTSRVNPNNRTTRRRK